jgi:DNA polymerase elongation subunit (family B)
METKIWNGSGYYDIKGSYNVNALGPVETALKKLTELSFSEKEKGNKLAAAAYKIVRNSVYGAMGNSCFKQLYDPIAASDCTLISATWVKKLSKVLEENGYIVLYGFTDSFYVRIPQNGSLEELQFIVDSFLKDAKSHLPFPQETFQIPLEEGYKFVWFVGKKKNSYLKVTNDNQVKHTASILNAATPKVILKIFDEYIKPKIVQDLDVKFTMFELKNQLRMELENDPSYAVKEYQVSELSKYKQLYGLQYKISAKYGPGKHKIIANVRGVGVPSSTKEYSYCTLEDFKKHNLTARDIYILPMLRPLEKFIKPYNMEVLK